MLVRGSGCAAPDYSSDSIINKHNLGSEASDLDNASLAERSNGTEKQEEEKRLEGEINIFCSLMLSPLLHRLLSEVIYLMRMYERVFAGGGTLDTRLGVGLLEQFNPPHLSPKKRKWTRSYQTNKLCFRSVVAFGIPFFFPFLFLPVIRAERRTKQRVLSV